MGKEESRLGTITKRLGTLIKKVPGAPSQRRPVAPDLPPRSDRSTAGVLAQNGAGGLAPPSRPAMPLEPDSPRSTPRLASPLEQVQVVLRKLDVVELGDVLAHCQRILAARGAGADPAVTARILDAMSRLHNAYTGGAGVPISVLRSGMPDVPRESFNRALLDLEDRKLVSLVPANPNGTFMDTTAGIHDRLRGFLYFCRAPDSPHKHP